MKVNKEWLNKSGIYKINFKNKCYIGSSKNIYSRLAQHISHLRAGKHHSRYMQRCYNKYGEENFNFEILEIIEYDEKILREKELKYIKHFKSVFNSTTPIEYHHNKDMKNRISKTLKLKYQNGEIKNPRLGRGIKISIYNFKGEILYDNITIAEATRKLNLSNRNVLGNNIRVGRAITKKFYIIIPSNENFQFLYKWIKKQKGLKVPIYKINSSRVITKCTMNLHRFRDKILETDNFLYYSKREDSYYTFIGNIINCPFYK